MRKPISIMVVVTVLILPAPAGATFGEDAAMLLPKLTAIYQQLREQYEKIKAQLEQAQAANETLNRLRKLSEEAYEEYRFVRDFSIEAEIKRIENDIDGLTDLDRLGEVDAEGKYHILRKEIKRRFRADEQTRTAMINRIAEIERLEALKQTKLDEAEQAGAGRMNTKSLQASVASSNALLTALALDQQQQEKRRMMGERAAAADAQAYEDSFDAFLRSEARRE